MKCPVLGVDGGNTKTAAWVTAEDGTVLGRGRAGCSDIYGAESTEAALEQLDRAVARALESAGCRTDDLAAACFSLAGADWPEDFDFLREALRRRGMTRNVSVYNDAFAPLRAGSDDFTGVAVVCGTGAATGARSANGATWHASWWQDVQGARQLGHRALWAVIHAELGIGPETAMTAGVLQAYGAGSLGELLHDMTRRGGRRWAHEVSAPVLVREAEAGDPVARSIAEEQGCALGDYALTACRQVGIGQLDCLVLAGTVLRRSTVIAQALCRRVLEEHPEARAVMPGLEPVAGAVLLAMDSAGITVTGATRARLAAGSSRG